METTYINNLNEFVDWTNGLNELTGVSVSGIDEEHKISGRSIRELLLKHLQVPFVTNETDEEKDKIYFFSSEYTKNLWKHYSDPDDVLYDEDKAKDLVLYSMDLPATYRITGLSGLNRTRYIIDGNSSSENAIISFVPGIEDSLGQPQNEYSVNITYTITDEYNNTTYNQTVPIDPTRLGLTITKNVYQYLKPGMNTVLITAVCNEKNARTSIPITIYLVSFQISSDFQGYYSAVSGTQPLQPMRFNLTVSRSITNLPITTTIDIRDNSVTPKTTTRAIFSNTGRDTWEYDDGESNFTKSLSLQTLNSSGTPLYLENRKYTMEIRSRMSDSENGQTFYSNTLVYDFEISSASAEIDNRFINGAYSLPSGQYNVSENGDIILQAVQYVPFTMNWGYHTDIQNGRSDVDVNWAIRKGTSEYTYTNLTTIRGTKRTRPNALRFVSSEALSHAQDNSYLVARISIGGTLTDVAEFPLTVSRNLISVTEASGNLKLTAYGKTNTSSVRNQWTDDINGVTTTFSESVPFDNVSGWNDDALTLRGVDAYATVNYCPFPAKVGIRDYNTLSSGAAFQIDFLTDYVNDENDVLMVIGQNQVGVPRIIITPTSAAFYIGSTPLVKTNFKSGERISLAFIINPVSDVPNPDSGMVFIVNNGVFERAAAITSPSLVDASGNIKIGGSRSGIKVYSIRAYRTVIEIKQALANYMFDHIDDAELLSRNDIYGISDTILYNELLGKQDLIVISTNPNDPSGLTNILHNASQKKNSTVNIERNSPDTSKNFTISGSGCRIRNHGQSTLSYPITSMKFWMNKSNVIRNNVELTPTLTCLGQAYLELGKNRYIMKDGAIPANKFVLLANYADSSGANNGALLRLIQKTWYNALIDGEYKLRTAPQLFASGAEITHGDVNLNEPDIWKLGKVKTEAVLYTAEDPEVIAGTKNVGDEKIPAVLYTESEIDEHNDPLDPWEEGYYNISPTSDNYDPSRKGKTWNQLSRIPFPYEIRVAADSFPCTVFYKEGDKNLTLLGLYVFMDDKKSDFVYGERSIYLTDDPTDPFCLKVGNSKKDKGINRVWDNSNVLQIEVVYPNSPLTSYVSSQVADYYTVDPDDDTVLVPSGTLHNYTDVYQVEGRNVSYYWEQHFELIYPDEDDIEGDKFQPNSAFVVKVTPFLNFLEWITDVHTKYNVKTKWWEAGVYSNQYEAFEATAHDHLDMYKLAAYYIFFLRFGLIDSVERNAQLKTYDGQHWHYEPWDMDIAIGKANNGVIAYDPPLTRDTKKQDNVTYAYSGRTAQQSNTLWDCLEHWTYWAEQVVPKVAEALYEAGLDYDSVQDMFDKEYVEKWSETLYNESGHYKYIDAASDAKWRLYLNGAGTSYRHWWLSKSMNYYDAKWACGDFTKHSIAFRINKQAGQGSMSMLPNAVTYFKAVYGMQGAVQQNVFGEGLYSATPLTAATIPVTQQLNDKMFCFIFGANSIQELDMSGLLASAGSSFIDIDFGDSYDKVLGSSIRSLKVGAATTPNIYTNPNASTYTSNLSKGGNQIAASNADTGADAPEGLEHLDVIGWKGDNTVGETWLASMLSDTSNKIDRKNIQSVYAMGCNKQEQFSSSASGNKFTDLRLPDSITTIQMTNSSWENISFWSSVENGNTATYTNVGIPSSINKVYFKGTTGRNNCSWEFVNSWITSIRADIVAAHPGYTDDQIEEALLIQLGTKVLIVDQVYWGITTPLSYRDLIRLYSFGNDEQAHPLKGYVRIRKDDITALEISNITTMFGTNVFNIGSTSSNLVVDNSTSIVRINVSGPDYNSGLTVDQSGITLREGFDAYLSANKFTLTADHMNNVVINNDISYDHLEPNTYYWGITTESSSEVQAQFATWKNPPAYANIEVVNLGDDITRTILHADVGDGTDYTLYVKVFFKEGNTVQSDIVAINIAAASWPDSYEIVVKERRGNSPAINARLFFCTSRIANDIFSATYSSHGGQLNPIYVMYKNACEYEFSLRANGTFNAPVTDIQYMLRRINNGSTTTLLGGQYRSYTDLNDGNSDLNDSDGDTYIGYKTNPTYTYSYLTENTNGIVLCTTNAVSGNDFPSAIYQLTARIKIASGDWISKYANIMVVSDSTPIIETGGALYNAISNKYFTDYNQAISGSIFKYHLYGLDNTLSFSGYTTVTSLEDTLKYTKYLTGLDVSGCTSLTWNNNDYDLLYVPGLVSLNMSGCTNIVQGVIDLTPCAFVTTVNLSGTRLGIKLSSANTAITTVTLGDPVSIDINGTTTLSVSNFNLTSIDYLDTVELEGVKYNDNAIVYQLFNKIYNPS